MICYLDRTFCGSEVEEHTCGRELTEEHKAGAEKWWGGEDYPVALGNFCDK